VEQYVCGPEEIQEILFEDSFEVCQVYQYTSRLKGYTLRYCMFILKYTYRANIHEHILLSKFGVNHLAKRSEVPSSTGMGSARERNI
jgi:hypothetical protein